MSDFTSNINLNGDFMKGMPAMPPMPNFNFPMPPLTPPVIADKKEEIKPVEVQPEPVAQKPVETPPEPAVQEPAVENLPPKPEIKVDKEEEAEVKSEEPKKEAVSNETEKEPEAEVEKAPTKRTRRSRTKKTADSAEPTSNEPAKENENLENYTLSVSPSCSIDDIVDEFELLPMSNDFEKSKEKIDDLISKIEIRKDMDAPIIRLRLEQIDEVLDIARNNTCKVKTVLDNYCEKESGIISIVKAATASGVNETARRKNAFKALTNYNTKDGDKVNLLSVVYALRYMFNYYQSVSEIVEQKRRLLNAYIDLLTHKNI